MVRRGITAIRQRHAGLHGESPGVDPAGFTLIELLVVIAIIALLRAILVPVLSYARKQAKAMVCQAKLREWGMVLGLYAQDNEGRFPCNWDGSAGAWLLRGCLLSITSKDTNAPQDSFYHFRTKDIACCPMATKPLRDDLFTFAVSGSVPASFATGPAAINGRIGPEYPAWLMVAPEPRFVGSYGVNRFLSRPGFQSGGLLGSLPLPFGKQPLGVDIFSLGGKANIPVVLDSAAPSGGPISALDGPSGESPDGYGLNYGKTNAAWPFCVQRHDGGFVNGLFLDWSVRKIGLKELWKLKWSKDFNINGPWTKAGGVKPTAWPPWMRGFKDY